MDIMAEISNDLPVPRPIRRHKHSGGYGCVFVKPPSESFQTECPACRRILKEPCLLSCGCGRRFCRECIEQVEKDAKPCPLCNEPKFIFLQDRWLEDSLKKVEVWCSHKKEGCEWKGKLENLEEHLKRDPFSDNQQNGCMFEAVECVYKCGECYQRRHVATHQNELCMKRPYSCGYCQSYASIFEDVTEIHYPQCGKYPFTLVYCPFRYSGCDTQLPRKDMPEHMKEATSTHLELLATVTQRVSVENQRLVQEIKELKQSTENSLHELNVKCGRLETENKNLSLRNQRQVTELQHKIKVLEEREQLYEDVKRKQQLTENEIQAQSEVAKVHLQIMDDEIQVLKEEGRKLKLDLQSHKDSPGWPFDFRVQHNDEEVYSPAFYTHPHGYRMCVNVVPNGVGDGEGTHVSIFIFMMRGPFDDYLKWPFQGKITIQLVNQVGVHNHVIKTILFTDMTPDIYTNRVTGSERAQNGWGLLQFLSHADFGYNAARSTQYLKENHLTVRVVEVVLM